MSLASYLYQFISIVFDIFTFFFSTPGEPESDKCKEMD